jgi:lipopolysaccharide transport system ATP-binding protein
MSPLAIKAQNIIKQYPIDHQRVAYHTMRDSLSDTAKKMLHWVNPRSSQPRTTIDTINALDDVSFDVQKGEIIGIIGRNGAGKSTLLKILSRITKPSSGFAITSGSVGAMLEVGTGFHLELTGRENVYVNGAVLGMRRKEIDQKFDEIIAFSGVEQFLDVPVKRYSTGMQFRLAFSVAAFLQPEILLVDEVLAVGDYAFQKMCLGKMGDVSKDGRTVLFVSHNMNAISQLCPRTIVLDHGSLSFDGKTSEAIDHYLQQSTVAEELNFSIQSQIERFSTDRVIRYESITIMQNSKPIANTIVMNGFELEIEIQYEVFQDTVGLRVFIDLVGKNEILLFRSYHDELSEETLLVKKGRYLSRVTIPRDLLAPKDYELRVLAEEYNRRTCLPESGIRIPITVEANGLANRAYMSAPIRGELAPVFHWQTTSMP